MNDLTILSKQNKLLDRENIKLKKEVERLKELALLDFLTRLYNRRAFNDFLKRACKEIRWNIRFKNRRERKESFSLLLIDIDDFKLINDKYGHLYGDRLLKRFAKFLKKSVREFDIVCRWGGEEFAIILWYATLKQAERKGNSILKECRKKLTITFSMGVVQSNYEFTPSQLLEKADKAMYEAKRQGKNRVVSI